MAGRRSELRLGSNDLWPPIPKNAVEGNVAVEKKKNGPDGEKPSFFFLLHFKEGDLRVIKLIFHVQYMFLDLRPLEGAAKRHKIKP